MREQARVYAHNAGENRYICVDWGCEKPFTTIDLAIFCGHGVTVSRKTNAPNILDPDACTDSDNGFVIYLISSRACLAWWQRHLAYML